MALIRKRLNSEIADPGNDYGTADLDATKGRQKPDTLIRKVFIRTFQCVPQKELTQKFRDFLTTRELPLEELHPGTPATDDDQSELSSNLNSLWNTISTY
jgi:hypothetical protein